MNIQYYESHADMQRFIVKKLISFIPNIDSCDSILDIGCGTGFIADILIAKGIDSARITNMDINQSALDFLQIKHHKTNIIYGDMHHQPFADKQFDIAFSAMALQWSHNITQAIAECTRVAKHFMLAVPLYQSFNNIREICQDLHIKMPIMHMPHMHDIHLENIEVEDYNFTLKPSAILRDIHNLGLKKTLDVGYFDLKTFTKIDEVDDAWTIGYFSSF